MISRERRASTVIMAITPLKKRGEKQITAGQRKAATEARARGKSDQLP